MQLIQQIRRIPRKPADHPIGYIVAISGAMMQIMCYGIDNSFSVFSKSMQKDASLGFPSATTVSFGNSVALGLTPAFGILAGFIVDRVPSRVLMFASTFLLFAGLWISSSCAHSSIAVTFSYCLLASLACACMLSPGPAVTSTWFKFKLGLAQGITFCGGGIGSAFIPAVLGQWVGPYGWRKTFRLASCFCAIGLVAAILSCKREEPDSDNEEDEDVHKGDKYREENREAKLTNSEDNANESTSHEANEINGEVSKSVKGKHKKMKMHKKSEKSHVKADTINNNEKPHSNIITQDASVTADNTQKDKSNADEFVSELATTTQVANAPVEPHEPIPDNTNVLCSILPPFIGTEPPTSPPSFSGFSDDENEEEDSSNNTIHDENSSNNEQHAHINSRHIALLEAVKLTNMTSHERLIYAMHTRKLTVLELIRVYMTTEFLANFFMMVIFGWAFYGLIYVTVPYVSSMGEAGTVYKHVRPIPTNKASTVFIFWGVFQVIGSVLMGGLASFTADEFAYCSCSLIGTIACIAFIFCRDYVGFAATLSIIGFCTAGMFAVMLALITKPMYGPNLGALMSCVFVAASVGGFSAPPIQAHLQSTHQGNYTYGCIFIALSMAVPGVICFIFLWKDKKEFLPTMARRYLSWKHKTAEINTTNATDPSNTNSNNIAV